MQLTGTILLAAAATASAQLIASVEYYQKSGCTGIQDGEAVFGQPGLCQPLDTLLPTVKSFSLLSVIENCTAHFYTDESCSEGDTVGVLQHCEEANFPFLTTKVICP